MAATVLTADTVAIRSASVAIRFIRPTGYVRTTTITMRHRGICMPIRRIGVIIMAHSAGIVMAGSPATRTGVGATGGAETAQPSPVQAGETAF